MYPNWVVHKDDLFDQHELCEALLSNVHNYGKFGPAVQELQYGHRLLQKFHSDGRGLLVGESLLKSLVVDSDIAIETAAYTDVIFFVRRELQNIVDDKKLWSQLFGSFRRQRLW